MAKLHFVKKSRKSNPVVGKGEPYYWWQHAFLPKQYSKIRPTRSQLVRSPFYKTVFEIEDSSLNNASSADDLESIVAEVEELRDEVEGSLENMPEGLQQSATGELLQERIDNLNQWIDDIEQVKNFYEGVEEKDSTAEEWEDHMEEFRGLLGDIPYPG